MACGSEGPAHFAPRNQAPVQGGLGKIGVSSEGSTKFCPLQRGWKFLSARLHTTFGFVFAFRRTSQNPDASIPHARTQLTRCRMCRPGYHGRLRPCRARYTTLRSLASLLRLRLALARTFVPADMPQDLCVSCWYFRPLARAPACACSAPHRPACCQRRSCRTGTR